MPRSFPASDTMGNAAPTEASAAPDQFTPEEQEGYDRIFRGEIDAEAAFEAAFEDDPGAEDLKRIVREIEGGKGDAAAVTEESKRLQKMADAVEKQQQKARKAGEKAAGAEADAWFKQQLQEGKAAEASARAAKEAAAELARRKAQEEAAKAAEGRAREVAKAEAAARAALFERASDVIRIQERAEEASVFEGVPLPRKLPEKAEEEEASVFEGVPLPRRLPEKAEEEELPANPGPPAESKQLAVPEFYRVLNVAVEATFEEIKKAYRKQALLWHPDKNRHRLEAATERFQKISEAFDTLYDPAKRSSYDAGEIKIPGRMKKLQGSGWSSLKDEDDAALTPLGVKYKKMSWRGYIFMYGRIDDDPEQIVQDDRDPRAPQEKIKVFWRFLGEMAHIDREELGQADWIYQFLLKIWKDTPTRWPKALELKIMNDAGQQEWKERRMVYNRRKQKLLIAIELHVEYLDIPDREKKERERVEKRRPGWAQRMEGNLSTDPFRV